MFVNEVDLCQLTAYDVEGASLQIRKQIDILLPLRIASKLIHKNSCLRIYRVKESAEHVEVEGRCEHFPPSAPLIATAGEQTFAQPAHHYIIFAALVEHGVALQYGL